MFNKTYLLHRRYSRGNRVNVARLPYAYALGRASHHHTGSLRWSPFPGTQQDTRGPGSLSGKRVVSRVAYSSALRRELVGRGGAPRAVATYPLCFLLRWEWSDTFLQTCNPVTDLLSLGVLTTTTAMYVDRILWGLLLVGIGFIIGDLSRKLSSGDEKARDRGDDRDDEQEDH